MVGRIPRASHGRMNLRIELGRAHLSPEDAARLGAGSAVSLDALVDEPVDIILEGRLVARGEVLVFEGSFCVRVTELIGGPRAA